MLLRNCVILLLLVFSMPSFAQVDLTNGLVAYYPFNGDANDASGNGRHLTLKGAPVTGPDRFGAPNTAMRFDGINDYLHIADNGAFSSPSFSVSWWFNTESNALQVMIGKREITASNNEEFGVNLSPIPGRDIGSYLIGNNRTCTETSVSGVSSTEMRTSYPAGFCNNNWHHIVITYSNRQHRIYIDGQLKNTQTTPFNNRTACNQELRFGMWWNGNPAWFKGLMDDIRWYDRAINAAEVTALFDNYSNVPASSMDFSFSQSACDPKQVSFTAANSALASASWDFGDGVTAAGTSASHAYAAFGTYPVKLKGRTAAGCLDSVVKQVPVFTLLSPSLVSSRDTSICAGQSVTLNASNGGLGFCWQPSAGLSGTGNLTVVATPTDTTTYYFTSRVQGANLVVNGDFEQGNTGFSSQYSYAPVNTTEAQYWTGNHSITWNPNLNDCIEHTTGTGQMMLVNGSPVNGARVWSQTITVLPNTNYSFSAWVQSLTAMNPARLRFSINNTVLGDNINAGTAACQWSQFYTVWNSGNTTSAVISIVNINTIALGNDFALDDISFSRLDMQYDSVTVNVVQRPDVRTVTDQTICAGESVTLTATGATHYSWSPVSGLSNSGSASVVASPSATIQYVVTGWDIPGCEKTDAVNITVNPLPVFGISPPQSDNCEGDELTISASGADTYDWFTSGQDHISSSDILSFSAAVTDTFYVALYSNACNVSDTLRSIVRVSPKPDISIAKSNDIDCFTPQARLVASGGTTYSWTPLTQISNPSIPDPVVSPDKDTWYKVVVSNGSCTGIDSVLVRSSFALGRGGFYIPNAFTPNNDGRNDCFGLGHWPQTGNFEFWLYNRWGELVFHTKNSQDCWDGMYKGKPQPSGTFVYQVKATSPCSEKPVYLKGLFNLIR